MVVKHAKRVTEPTDRARQTISSLITATNDPAFALAHLSVFTKINLLEPFVALLRNASGRQGSNRVDVDVDGDSIKRILDTHSEAGSELIKTLADISPSASRSFVQLIQADKTLLEKPELFPTFQLIVALPSAISQEQGLVLAKTAIESIRRSTSIDQSASARSILRDLATVSPDQTSSMLLDLAMSAYNGSFARLARELAEVENAEEGVRGLVRVGLLWLTRLASSSAKLEDVQLAMFGDLGQSGGVA